MKRLMLTSRIGIAWLTCSVLLTGCAMESPGRTTEPYPNIDDPQVAEFYHQIRVAVERHMDPVLEAEKAGIHGQVLVDFSYDGGGTTSDVHVSGTSHSDRLDKAGLYAVGLATLPNKPDSMMDIHHYTVEIALTASGPEVSTVTLGHNRVSYVTGSGPIPCSASKTPPAATQDLSPQMAFEVALQRAVDKKRYYPKESIIADEQGVVEVEFDYLGGGKATDITLGAITATDSLNQAAIGSVRDADLPPKPPELVSVTHFKISLTFALNSENGC